MSFVPVVPHNADGPNSDDLLKELKASFYKEFKSHPTFAARCPGRVNLIGEHIDYCGYAVLPMAIDQHVVIAVSTNSSRDLSLADRDPIYAKYSCDVKNIKINNEPFWYNYVLCGVLGILEHFHLEDPLGMCFFIDSNVPPSAGLSSSSALVCAAALATLHANGLTMTKQELAALCAHSERYIGTEGGGMDQAIAFLAESGTAKLIEFNPIQTTDVQLPMGATFVIANSCADINKAATSDYNTRVVECRLAAQILAKRNGLDWKKNSKLCMVQSALQMQLPKMVSMVKEVLHQAPYTRKEILSELDITDEDLVNCSLSANTRHLEKFHLFQRALHVYSEAFRVWEFKRICDEKPHDILKQLGDLMNTSHASCRDLYDCSHPNLDKLVEISVNAGALGSRLTGAGWGGCSVSLVPHGKVADFLQSVGLGFFQNQQHLSSYNDRLFPTQPGSGAIIYEL